MKRLLGNIMLWLLLATALSADYSWSVSAAKQEFFTNEAVEIVLKCEFSDAGYGYNIELEGLDNPKYGLKLLTEKETLSNGIRVNEYRFVMFANDAAALLLELHANMRRTTKESIENSIIGRDNVEELAFVSKVVALPPLQLHVKQAPVNLVGDFKMDVMLSTQHSEAYKPINIALNIKGTGNFDVLKPFELKIKNAEVFAEEPTRSVQLTSEGYEGTLTQNFAVVGSENYTIEPFELEYFNPHTRSVEKESSKLYAIEVSAAYSKEELLDDVPSDNQSKSQSIPWFSYLLILLLGVILGRYSTHLIAGQKGTFLSQILNITILLFKRLDNMIWRIQSDADDPKKRELQQAIRDCKNEKSLQILLIVSDEMKFRQTIEALTHKQTTLKKAKEQALKCV